MTTKSILMGAVLLGGFGGLVWATAPAAMTSLTMSAEDRAATEAKAYYAGCDDVRAQGKDPIYAGQPGYRSGMDGDGDGVACEPYRR